MTDMYLIVGIDKEICGFCKKCTWINCSVIVSVKKTGNTSTYLYTFINAKNLFKMPNMHFKSQIYRIQIFLLYNSFICLTACWPASLPAVRPGFTMARAPMFSHNKGNCFGFMKLLYRRKFIHCAMMLPFILY